jgi:hypothetical protein
MSDEQANTASDRFLKVLEENVKRVLEGKKVKPSERMAAVAMGIKILALKHRIFGDGEKGFFE